jgi:hypothetical protein
LKGGQGFTNEKKHKAPGLILDRISGLVDEVEVYRTFGGCLPAESTAANSFFKTLRQLNAQRDGDAKTIEDWIIKSDLRINYMR